eukprot:TRINITY_DN7379_c0_g1_i1.p2 TRINITY_DN7379_c0_g1~~TRINITY_DN7379_c0_g1_i1.p2  ORF type:complete len:427 (-),score=87.96 TRINITY_DN7379_c0_g1_i1:179-1459(-)
MDELEELCTCWICFEIFVDPTTLPCNHSFCKECLVKVYKKEPSCAFCRRPFSLPLPEPNQEIVAMVARFLSGKDGMTDVDTLVDQESALLYLPNEVLAGIFGFLDPRDLARSATVCRNLGEISSDPFVWRELVLRKSPFANISRFGRDWRKCYRALHKAQVFWESGRAGGFDLISLRGHTNYVTSLQLYRGRVLSSSADFSVRLWDAYSGNCLHTLQGHTQEVTNASFNEVRVVSGSLDGTVRISDTGTAISLQTLNHNAPVNAVVFDNAKIASAGGNGEVKLWDLRDGSLQTTLSRHASAATSVQIDNQGRIVSNSSDSLRVWDSRNAGQPIHTFPAASVFALGENHIISGNAFGAVTVYSSRDGGLVHTLGGGNVPGPAHRPFNPNAHMGQVRCLATDGNKIVSGGNDRSSGINAEYGGWAILR